jgi:UDP-glucose 4-epimerase
MRILITGGFGYLGSYLAHELSTLHNHQIRIVARKVPPHFEPWKDRFEVLQADVTQKAEIGGCCRECQGVLHLAALDREESRTDPARALQVLGAGTKNILEEALLARVARVVYFSTIHVYRKSRETTVTEESPVQPLDDYSISHYLGELYCERFRELLGLDVVRLRLANGFGAPIHTDVSCWSTVVHDFCRSALARGEIVIRSQGGQRRDLIPISDIRQAVDIVLGAPPDRLRHSLYNVASGVAASIDEIATRVQRVYLRSYGKLAQIRHEAIVPSGEPGVSYAVDPRRIQDLGFQPSAPEAVDAEIVKIFACLASTGVN